MESPRFIVCPFDLIFYSASAFNPELCIAGSVAEQFMTFNAKPRRIIAPEERHGILERMPFMIPDQYLCSLHSVLRVLSLSLLILFFPCRKLALTIEMFNFRFI
jgi:hypothetical protein